jgi:prevent-host-death family protein
MNSKNNIWTVSCVRSRASDLLKQVNETQSPVVITQNGVPRGVIQDPGSYARMKNALVLLKKISQGEEDICLGKFSSQKDVFERLSKSIGGN